MLLLLLLPALLDLSYAGLFGFTQSIAVRGQLMCNNRPASNVRIKLYDNDPIFDDHMASEESRGNGRFVISGTSKEISRIDPKINIYHDCDDILPCQRRITIYIPRKYITKGLHADQVYDAGVIQLAGKFSGETRDCIHRH